MSIFKSIGKLALQATAGFIPGGTQALSLFGGNGEQNVARSLSKQVGCTVLQKDADLVRRAMKLGLDPCNPQRGVVRPGGPAPVGFGATPQSEFAAMSTPSVMTGMSAVPAVIRAGVGLIRTTTGRATGVILASGQRFSRAKAVALLRRVGLDVGAAALGITLVEAAELLLTASTAGRRRRGITGAQLATTRRTICTLKRMTADLGISRAAPRRRKTACR